MSKLSSIDRALELAKPSIWAERHRLMNGKPYTFRGREFLRDIHDEAAPSMVVRKGAQVGVTEAVMNIALCDVDAGIATMYVLPTERVRDRHVAARVNAILRESEYARAMFDASDSLRVKMSGSVPLYFEGSNSQSGGHSVPVGSLIIDEVDRCQQSALPEFEKRLSGNDSPRSRAISTPTYPGRGVDARFDRSSRAFWQMRCSCGHSGTLHWDQPSEPSFPPLVAIVRWDGWPEARFVNADARDATTRTARYECLGCGKAWSDAEKRAIVSAGTWKHENPQRDLRGYHVPQTLSPNLTAPQLVGDYFDALKDEETGARAGALRTFYNSVLGVPYLSQSERIERAHVEAISHSFAVPRDSLVCAGIDVGAKKHVCIGTKLATGVTWEFVELDTFEEVMALLDARGVVSAVFDAHPEREAVERICEQEGGRVYRAFTPTDPVLPLAWDEPNKIVRISRVSIVSMVLARIRQQSAKLLRNKWASKAADHLTRVTVVDEIASSGEAVRRVMKLSPEDHFFWAAVYFEVAAKRIAESTGKLEEQPGERSEDPLAPLERRGKRDDTICGVLDLGDERAFAEPANDRGFDAW